ncbi:MAG: hypothetical protein IIB09_05040 [Bacteroidetes bacterium]|nr:hypothetical protein [Bacteroidota bacterium]
MLTHRCTWQCGYCPYPVTAGPSMPSKRLLHEAVARARDLGLVQLKVTGGEALEIHPEVASTVSYYGFRDFTDYLNRALFEITNTKGGPPLFSELDLGAMSLVQMHRLRANVFTLRLFLDSMDPKLQYGLAHARSRGKWPKQRLASLLAAGRLGIPVNSGIMVGIGESPSSRGKTLSMLAEISRRYGHIQSVAIRPFEPHPRTPMRSMARPSPEELLEVVAEARRILPRGVAVQFPISNYPERVIDFIQAGADDLGELELTGEARGDARAINTFKIVKARLDAAGISLVDRLSLFPRFSNAQWLTPRFQKMLREANRPEPKAEISPEPPVQTLQDRRPSMACAEAANV